jgi:hypothetical protein
MKGQWLLDILSIQWGMTTNQKNIPTKSKLNISTVQQLCFSDILDWLILCYVACSGHWKMYFNYLWLLDAKKMPQAELIKKICRHCQTSSSGKVLPLENHCCAQTSLTPNACSDGSFLMNKGQTWLNLETN